MLGAVAVLEERIVRSVRSVPRLRLVPMPEASYIGELYETPKQRHPQENSLAGLYRVSGLGDDDGVYAIPVFDDETPQRVFLSEAKKVTSRLPHREGVIPTYGMNEVTLYPEGKNEVLDLREKPELHRTLVKGVQKAFPNTSFDFV
ncbi:MAG: hypothetical protein KGI37_01270 [Alphaproteobacteria bacterium]|nr:hypothetical protein [Alphaproteobacteria bacterium]